MMAEVTLTPIAYIQSCYPDRFGIPRQAGLVKSAYADIVFDATEDNKLALRGIDEFSHLWVLFIFHGQTYGNFERRVQVCPVCIRNCIYRQVYNLLKTFSHLEEVV